MPVWQGLDDVRVVRGAGTEQAGGWLPDGQAALPGIRAAHGAHEGGNPGVVFHAFGGLHATAYIDSVGPHALNRASDVLRVQPTTQNDPRSGACGRVVGGRKPCRGYQGPVEDVPATALAFDEGIKQQGSGITMQICEFYQIEARLHACRAQKRQPAALGHQGAVLGALVAVELQ